MGTGQELTANNDREIHLVRAELDVQITTANRFPRDPARIVDGICRFVGSSENIAEDCLYGLPRKDKDGNPVLIQGPSIRLLELFQQQWRNLRVQAWVSDVTPTEIVAVAQAWDCETNNAYSAESRRPIVGRRGRFSQDIISMIGMACMSIARRNALLGIIPRVYVDRAYQIARDVAAGNERDLPERRARAVEFFKKMGVTEPQICAVLQIKTLADIDLDRLATLRGFVSSIRSKEATIEDIFGGDDAPGAGNGGKPTSGTEGLANALGVNGSAPTEKTNPAPPAAEWAAAVPAREAKETTFDLFVRLLVEKKVAQDQKHAEEIVTAWAKARNLPLDLWLINTPDQDKDDVEAFSRVNNFSLYDERSRKKNGKK